MLYKNGSNHFPRTIYRLIDIREKRVHQNGGWSTTLVFAFKQSR